MKKVSYNWDITIVTIFAAPNEIVSKQWSLVAAKIHEQNQVANVRILESALRSQKDGQTLLCLFVWSN